ncbi:MAG TPA: hypothetical protein VFL62_10625 [Bradyrhizobium sp.]|uniref:hypothetical protein n=1 Tax=Bradyrhizobium sp. TaxID=376 RepID=UPI002D7E4EC6|nr:hypothetical protein [Bradyrhizobium sp.]HET7886671.1 hypothetical protein [Bradyrhizobium sp.]
MPAPGEDTVDALLTGTSDLSRWLLTVGVLAMGMTPLGLILAGIPGALLTSAFFVFVWLASIVWVFAQRGSLGATNVLPSALMIVAWPVTSVAFALLG